MKKLKNSIKKNFIARCFLFTGILLILLYIPSYILSPEFMTKHELNLGRNEVYAKVANEKNDTIDVIVLGDSLSYTTVSPMQIWEEYGYAVFDAGAPGQNINETLEVLEISLEKQHPKMALLETNELYRKTKESGKDSRIAEVVYKACPVFKYHNVWKTPFVSRLGDSYKGYVFSTKVKAYKGGEYLFSTDKKRTIPKENEETFKKIKKLCDENGVKLILYSAPSPKCYNMEKINAINEFADKYGIDYIDLNKEKESLNINWSKDTRDKGDHLNSYGTKKTTVFIARKIDSYGILKDRRNDENF
ncbi:MAG: hypothetical protein II653_04320, partial [Lachnospiraceae bacterium]|nr:hypothetical protein [Lachnospiraceae bacterium]